MTSIKSISVPKLRKDCSINIVKKSGSDERFKMKDRKNRNKSIRMFNIWADAYHKPSSFEKMARNWNGGPKGYKKSKTEKYWTKVKKYAKANL